MSQPHEDPSQARPVDHANAAAEAIRALNHATLWRDSPDGYAWPADVDATVAALETLAQRLPQALTQAAVWLLRAQTDGRVGHDTLTDPEAVAETVATLRVLLRFAGARAQTLADDLTGIHQETAHLTGTAPDPATTGAEADELPDGDGDEW